MCRVGALLALSVTLVALLAFSWLTNQTTVARQGRANRWGYVFLAATSPKTRFELNSWYMYAKFLAAQANQSRCYVCTRMPISTQHNNLRVVEVHNQTDLFPDVLVSRVVTGVLSSVVPGFNESLKVPWNGRKFSKFISTNASDPLVMTGVPYPSIPFQRCYVNNHSLAGGSMSGGDARFLGAVPLDKCVETVMPCLHPNNKTSMSNCTGWYRAPDMMGTYPQSDFYWMCGHSIFLNLPPNWVGRCVPVKLTHHSYVVIRERVTARRQRRDLQPHDSVWGSDVPQDQKLWTTAQKVTYSFLPWIGVGKFMLRMETFDYRLGLYMNATNAAITGLAEEVTALRTMEMQDRMVLDLLAAPQGGVCAIIGESCCTFVPDNAGDEGVITQAISNLTKLADIHNKDHVQDAWMGGWFSWLSPATWRSGLTSILTMVVVCVLILALVTCCVIPLVRSCISRFVNTKLLAVCTLVDTGDHYGSLTDPASAYYKDISDDDYDDAVAQFHSRL